MMRFMGKRWTKSTCLTIRELSSLNEEHVEDSTGNGHLSTSQYVQMHGDMDIYIYINYMYIYIYL